MAWDIYGRIGPGTVRGNQLIADFVKSARDLLYIPATPPHYRSYLPLPSVTALSVNCRHISASSVLLS